MATILRHPIELLQKFEDNFRFHSPKVMTKTEGMTKSKLQNGKIEFDDGLERMAFLYKSAMIAHNLTSEEEKNKLDILFQKTRKRLCLSLITPRFEQSSILINLASLRAKLSQNLIFDPKQSVPNFFKNQIYSQGWVIVIPVLFCTIFFWNSQKTKNDHGVKTQIHKLETFTKNRNYPYVALSSYYGSGNTWMRHLLQLYSGISTSTLYNDGEINTNSDLNREAEQIKNSVCENEPDISNYIGYGSYTGYFGFYIIWSLKINLIYSSKTSTVAIKCSFEVAANWAKVSK